MIRHLVMFSGGVCSWAAAKRVVEKHGTEGVVLLFADTKMEDEDLYRFIGQAEYNVGVSLEEVSDGRTPWDVMRDHHCIANSRIDPCSEELKRNLLDRWRNEHCRPGETTIYLGLDWTETHRLVRVNKLCAPWNYEAPMTEPPYLTKRDMLDWLRREGIEPPRLYGMGFPHNNCGGFCVKAGQAQFALLLRTMPERYRFHEEQEEALRSVVGNHSILSDRTGGTRTPISLKAFRERIEQQGDFDRHEWGGCGCAIE
jgi:hypothetical protein